jgi:transcriptional regulator GlxA family with amidase domain
VQPVQGQDASSLFGVTGALPLHIRRRKFSNLSCRTPKWQLLELLVMPTPSVAVVAYHHFNQFHLSVPCMIFGNILPGHSLFALKVCTADPGPVHSEHGLQLNTTHGVDALAEADIVVVPGWSDAAVRPESLRAAHARGAQVVGLCLGTYVLAYAGLLDGRKAATHWEYEQDFVSRFPEVQLDTNVLYVDNDRLITSAGTAASMDCCLYLMRQHHGSAIANKIARRVLVPTYRDGGQAQFIEKPMPVSTNDARINRLLGHLRQDLQAHYSLDELAESVHMSRRTLTRSFQKATGMSIGEWLLAERLQHTQELLEASSQPIEMIAELAGFGTARSLRQHFRGAFGVSPGDWRRNFRNEGSVRGQSATSDKQSRVRR